jgi:hypothetical protein
MSSTSVTHTKSGKRSDVMKKILKPKTLKRK